MRAAAPKARRVVASPLAAEWKRTRGMMTKVDDTTAEMLRLMFFHGARFAARVMADKNGLGAVMMSCELRDFNAKMKDDCNA